MVTIVALDPGTTTGLALYNEETDWWERWQFGPKPHHLQLWDWFGVVGPDVIVCEGFLFQPRRDKIVLDSLEYIGVAKLWCAMSETPLVLQTVAQGKDFWTDKKVQTLNLWLANQPHAMDATRHLLYYWMTQKDNRFVRELAGDREGA